MAGLAGEPVNVDPRPIPPPPPLKLAPYTAADAATDIEAAIQHLPFLTRNPQV